MTPWLLALHVQTLMGSIGFLPKCIMFKFHMFINVALPQAKRLAIALYWLAQASSFAQIAALYAIVKSSLGCPRMVSR